MPQMKPMNWILISILIIFSIKIMKLLMYYLKLKSKTQKKNLYYSNMIIYKW